MALRQRSFQVARAVHFESRPKNQQDGEQDGQDSHPGDDRVFGIGLLLQRGRHDGFYARSVPIGHGEPRAVLASYSPAMVMFCTRTEPLLREPRTTMSLPAPAMPRNISLRLPATVISSTG